VERQKIMAGVHGGVKKTKKKTLVGDWLTEWLK
jgi:hypothetical protein